MRPQARLRYSLLGCLLAPIAVVLVLSAQQRPLKDTLCGRYIHDSGDAMPLLVLGFAAQWVLPLLTALVAGISSPPRTTTAPGRDCSPAR